MGDFLLPHIAVIAGKGVAKHEADYFRHKTFQRMEVLAGLYGYLRNACGM